MKILWIVNTIFPYPAEKLNIGKTCYGGWLNGLANELKKIENIELCIATIYTEKKLQKFNDGKISYYLVPGAPAIKYDKKMEKYWAEVNNEFKPDLVHIHGTEYTHGLAFKNACPNSKIVTSIQGLASKVSEVYYAGMTELEIFKNITFRDLIKFDTIFHAKKQFKVRGKYEIELIKNSDFIIGRTTWDYSNTKNICSNAKYYHCNEILRPNFYAAQKWEIDKIERNSIYLSQAGYPIKGLHILLKAICQLKKEGYNIKLYISGPNIIEDKSLKSKIKLSGYGKFIKTLINKLNLKENVFFIGNVDENEVIERLLKSHIVVLPSIIENESNSISEAGLLGVPTVSSYVGGIVDRIDNGINGYTYPFIEYSMLANYIKKIFDDDKLALKISREAIKKYQVILDKNANLGKIIEIYNEILIN